MQHSESENQRLINNFESNVKDFIGKVTKCNTMKISDDIIKITHATESLECSLRQKQLTKEQEKLLDHVRTEYERGLEILETHCKCREY